MNCFLTEVGCWGCSGKSYFGFTIPFIRFGKKLAWLWSFTLKTSLQKTLSFLWKSNIGQSPKIRNQPNLNTKITFWHGIWIPLIQFDKIWHGHWLLLKLNPETSPQKNWSFIPKSKMAAAVKRQKSVKFDPTKHFLALHLDPVHPIWTKFGIGVLLDPRNRPVQEYLVYCKIQDAFHCQSFKIG